VEGVAVEEVEGAVAAAVTELRRANKSVARPPPDVGGGAGVVFHRGDGVVKRARRDWV
jgi:hypothetical protein